MQLRRKLLAALGALALTLAGCAMTGGDEEGGSSSTPRDVDTVTMKNGDVLVGELDLGGKTLSIKTTYLDTMAIERRHLESMRTLASGEVKVRTEHGDILHGSLASQSLTLRTKTGKDVSLKLEDIEKVTFAE